MLRYSPAAALGPVGGPGESKVAAMMMSNIGTPLACIGKGGEVNIHPAADERVFGQSLIILVKTEYIPNEKEVQEAFRKFNSSDMSA